VVIEQLNPHAQEPRMLFQIEIEGSNERFVCGAHDSVLKAMEQLRRRGIPVGCRGGGCGACKVHVTQGEYETKKMSRSCVTADEEANGFALACRLHPSSDLKVKVVGKMARAVMARKSASFDFGLTNATRQTKSDKES
jgi:ferredoxin